MTIAQAFNDITIAQGGTPSTGGTITGAIDALNDTLAGSDQPSANTIEGAIRLLGSHIGGGSSVTVEALTATENKTYTAPDGKAYSPVTVNVSGGLPTANVTLVNSDDTNEYAVFLPNIYEYEEDGETYSGIESYIEVDPGDTYTAKVPLYGNDCTHGFPGYWNQGSRQLIPATITVSGNITEEGQFVNVTGDGTITITGMVS